MGECADAAAEDDDDDVPLAGIASPQAEVVVAVSLALPGTTRRRLDADDDVDAEDEAAVDEASLNDGDGESSSA